MKIARSNLNRGREAARIFSGCDQKLVDVRLTEILKVKLFGQLYNS
jgi:hypothetical protein